MLHLIIFAFFENIFQEQTFLGFLKLNVSLLPKYAGLAENVLKDFFPDFTNKRWHLCKFLEN